eukprot:CAMPEP_0183562454 /NCGR_PEP_ID=MMETSP0371-20130417/97687_1 /TAXON_ID=268820 /ORGANISM="Peridinium aciculiferum, Strain PAER-2" /LENGTH=63 /DNA_ID=CAMNT_0025771155 /DNA_START=19 /DNA_END=206 /DNA_ORIENTATION=-
MSQKNSLVRACTVAAQDDRSANIAYVPSTLTKPASCGLQARAAHASRTARSKRGNGALCPGCP